MEYTFSYREKNGSICLILSYKVGTKWRQKTKQGFKNQREARRYQDELLSQVKELEGLTSDINLKDMSLRQFFPIFERDKRELLAYGTIANYSDAVKRLKDVADVPMRDLTQGDLLNAILSAGLKLSSQRSTLSSLSPIFEHARKTYKIISVNPAKGIQLAKEKTKKDPNIFSRDEVAELLDLFNPNPVKYLLVKIGALTGMRFGEIVGLSWSAIDWDKKTITVRQQIALTGKNQRKIKSCKTRNSNRVIPASVDLLRDLKAWRLSQPLDIHGMIFPDPRVHRYNSSINKVIRKHFPGRSFHGLRHTFATLLLSKTGDINLVACVLGDTVSTVSEVYVGYSKDIAEKAAKAVNDLY